MNTQKKLSSMINDVYDTLKKAQEFADQEGLCFDFRITHDISGTYYPVSDAGKNKFLQNVNNGIFPSTTDNGWIAGTPEPTR